MATPSQILANQANRQVSTRPSEGGKLASSRNNLKHGLCHTELFFALLPGESQEDFAALAGKLRKEQDPQNMIETILVRRMAESEWLRARAVGLQTNCLVNDPKNITGRLALYIRYQTTHERSFYRALNELQKPRQQKTNAEIGFESQRLKKAAAVRASESLNLRIEVFLFQKEVFRSKNIPQVAHETGPGSLEKAA
jgi:hypothetical protein